MYSQMNNYRQAILLGKIPLLTSRWPEFNDYKKDIVDLCLEHEVPNTIESNVAVNAKANLWESTFDFLEKHPSLQKLKIWLTLESTELINNFNNSNHRLAIIESWAHVTRAGGFHKPHYHNNSTWSGIFYVDAENNKGGSNNWYLPYYLERKPGLEFADSTFTVHCSPGNLVLFPSALLHDADVYYGTLPRVVISFNSICL